MKRETQKAIKKDCRGFLRTVMLASFFHRLTNIAAPTVAARLIGDMTNDLIHLDKAKLLGALPSFLCAVLVQVVLVSVFQLFLNLLLTRQGFAYDSYLMNRFIHLPLSTSKTVDAGSVMERLEEDSSAFCWNQMTVCVYPFVLLVYASVLGYLLFTNGCPAAFALTILVSAACPIFRSLYIGKAQASHKKKASEYQGSRKQMEQELFEARDFAQCNCLQSYFTGRLDELFHSYLQKSGAAQYRMNAKSELLDFICRYAAPLCTIVTGALLISSGDLTLGTLLSGYLMIPSMTQCFQYLRSWITEKHNESRYVSRMELFYADCEEQDTPGEMLASLDASDLSFAYSDADAPVLSHLNFHLSQQENSRLLGSNGSGKSTLMSILAGLYEPQSGQVCFGASVGRRRKSVALQEQDGTIFSGTIWENLFLPEDKREQAAQLLRDMGMEKALEFAVLPDGANLSPGEKKKILLTRVLLRDAAFLLLDEPQNHLDEQGTRVLRRMLAQRAGGVLLISHQDSLCDALTLQTFDLDHA